MKPAACLRHFEERAGEMLRTLERLVAIDSPSGDAEAIARFQRAYGVLLAEAGMPSHQIPETGGPHLFGAVEPAAERLPPLVLVGHADTVWPRGEAERRPPRVEGERLHGPGVYDMRAGLVVALFALRFLREAGLAPERRLQIFISADEEVGSRTAHPHMERLLSRDTVALVLEPPLEDGSLKARRKGVGMYDLEAHGIESHAGHAPERGASAVLEIARKVVELAGWTDPARGISVNVGQIRGGIATNVIAGQATAGIDVRFDRLEDGEAVDSRLRALRAGDPRVRFELRGGIIFPPLVPDDRSDGLVRTAIRLAGELGLVISAGKSGGGSDGSFLAAIGLGVLDGLGVEGGGAHARDEHIRIDRLAVRAALLARLILELGA